MIEQRSQRLQAEMHEWARQPDRKKPSAAISVRGFVYFLLAEPFVKIGFTTNMASRLNTLQISSAVPLQPIAQIAGTRSLESRLHRRFRHLHQRGEWFRFNQEIEQYLAEKHNENRHSHRMATCQFQPTEISR